MSNQPTICLTGFTSDPKVDDYIEFIQKLHCKHVKKMCETTQLLIVKNTATQKYKIAKLNKQPISCVTINWLIDCKKKKKILPYTNYQIPHIFYGVTVVLAGFNDSQTEALLKTLNENGATVHAISKLSDLNDPDNESDTEFDAIVTTPEQIQRLGQKMRNFTIPIVGIEWIKMSLLRKMCKFPRDYALNYQYLKQINKSVACQIPKLSDRLKNFLMRDLFDREFEFLANVRVYFDEGVDYKIASLLKKIVCVCGGIYMKEFSPMVTHVITDSITETDYQKKYLKFGNMINIVRVVWLIDCIFLYKRLEEEDYKIKQFASKLTRDSPEFELNKVHSASFNTIPLHLMKSGSRNSISINIEKHRSQRVENITATYKSTIFKNLNFFIDSSQKKESDMHRIGTKIRENGGKLYDGVPKQTKPVYMVMRDSESNIELLRRLEKFRQIIIPVSYRWVNQCVQSNQFIPSNSPTFYIFRALNFSTPNKDFMNLNFDILGKDEVAKKRIREFLNVLGSVRVSANKSNLTHCICMNDYRQIEKHRELRKVNPNIKFVKFDWVLKCVEEKSIVDTSDFLCPE